jgi:hypothetical protein
MGVSFVQVNDKSLAVVAPKILVKAGMQLF